MSGKNTTELAGEAQAHGRGGGRALRAQLFERIMERIHRYFVNLVWDAESVDDCLQQTLLRLEQSLQSGSYDPQRSFNRWMWIKAHSVYVDYCRKHKHMAGLPGDGAQLVAGGRGANPAEVAASSLDAQAVLAALRGSLDAESFEMFVLHFGEQASVSEVAAVTGRDRKTVRKRLASARAAALAMLGEGVL